MLALLETNCDKFYTKVDLKIYQKISYQLGKWVDIDNSIVDVEHNSKEKPKRFSVPWTIRCSGR